jgi:hypothetical protein
VYDGSLPAAGRSTTRNDVKVHIRRELSKQLRELWRLIHDCGIGWSKGLGRQAGEKTLTQLDPRGHSSKCMRGGLIALAEIGARWLVALLEPLVVWTSCSSDATNRGT